ncbi:hypothetical protein ACEPAI_3270 [Sanghuangporus weigelae]
MVASTCFGLVLRRRVVRVHFLLDPSRRKRTDRLCKCLKCVESAGNARGMLVPQTTYRSHQERATFLKNAKPLPRIRLIVRQPSLQRKTTFTLTAEQELYAASSSRREKDAAEEGDMEMATEGVSGNEDLYDFTNDGSDYGDLYVDAMDVDLLPGPGTLQQEDSSGSEDNYGRDAHRPGQEADAPQSSSSDLGDDRDEPFRFDVPDTPPPAREIFAPRCFEDWSYPTFRWVRSVVNLPVHLRYKPSNLLVISLSPGPKESSCEELQHLLEAVVDDLLRLYEEGIEVRTPHYPNGRKIHVYCIADGCDHPALCRVVGFADHSHLKLFCTRCKIPRDELNSIQLEGITGTYPARTGDEHRRLARKYRDAEPGDGPGQREELFKKDGTRYYAMSRLSYFDAVRMSAIDPMHNILLGMCKSQWLDSWVRRNVLRERTRRKLRVSKYV